MSEEDTIKKIFGEVIGIDESEITDSIAYNSYESWDSLVHLELVNELEDTFDVEFEMDDIIAMETFGKVKEIVKKYLS
ncbi:MULTISPECIES: acyl carrier protein [Methanohalophilus]|jgi:acyl carrier protein|uniref:Acyl carrier protein n=1 Tax=Methanohalophilus euhalobius TaxID=51203 RepID=A0A314ZYL8_9EURY|nr:MULTISPECIES: acyl carrier protein [Methanohalophilus]OBZ34806.1 MAG: acyl carrier protein [Methanohalophilus sp. DAL1]PQV41835.1 acyl carrier protein [Methanohalophilus euhalobius]RNI07237.1 acyl carrier protein [Methanohalophilus euhalobius]